MKFPLLLTVAIAATLGNVSPIIASQTLGENKNTQITSDKQLLKARLEKLEKFSANFEQLVTDESGTELQRSRGTLAVQKPNLVYWQTTQPEESLIVSDGETLWLFDPFIEQATAYSLASSIANTPILLLTSNDENLWHKYQVTKQSEQHFSLMSLDENAQVKSLAIIFEQDTVEIKQFTIVDVTGQTSDIFLTDVEHQKDINPNLFIFTVPEGVYLDDQR
ncbi:outer membrane lipoprotein chaperone LolA [Thalassotalea sediminis]|uniref:outer membrane lipoprotein chaperone LolA n=1 Tax=Thalassotalea sediminis TaxID=1759089 RepID=UPI0025744891|nr:outer membrane lipoprotein chaperone LolA [Thalassotalea sediminis]